MPYWRVYYHIVWATKDRRPLLQPDIELRLFPYLVSKAAEMGAQVYEVNGWFDHVHMLVSIPPKHAIAAFVKRLKGASSFDLNQSRLLESDFSWQRGYGVLSLGESQLSRARAYVRNQKEHHRQDSTNAWLERVDEFDDGPPEVRHAEEMIRETAVVYELNGTDDFP